MTIKSDIPQICALRERIEKKIGKTLNTHSDFIELTSLIELELRQHISESTLERVWNYSTRGYDNVSLRTLNVLSNFAIGKNWNSFCDLLKKENKTIARRKNYPQKDRPTLYERSQLIQKNICKTFCFFYPLS